MRWPWIAFLSCLLMVSTANAAWLEAGSDHFVIYGDQDEKSLRALAERLELFHSAMSYVFKKPPSRPSPSNRVTIFVVSNDARVRAVTGTTNPFLVGVYLPRAGSAVAVIPKAKRTWSKYEMSGEAVLYHEYAHHFMAGLTARTYPRWFVEGFAEFFAGVQFRPDGSVGLGAPPAYRAPELVYAREVPIRSLLDFDGGAGDAPSGNDSFYGQSGLLFHYLQLAPERAGQLEKYELLLATGASALEAAEGAFGDLDQLRRDLQSYQMRRRVGIVVVDRAALDIGTIVVRQLRPGESAMMPVVIESKVGVTREEALSLLPEARRVAELYPHDPAVLAALAEAEFDAGNDDAAIAAADRALAADPGRISAHLQKGYALFRKVESGALPAESWPDVRSQFIKANKLENDHPIPLLQYYVSYLAAGAPPTKVAVSGLEWAMELAPFDASLRWLAAQQMISDDRLDEAARTLVPLAYSPHPGEHTDMARRLLQQVEARLAAAREPAKDAPTDE